MNADRDQAAGLRMKEAGSPAHGPTPNHYEFRGVPRSSRNIRRSLRLLHEEFTPHLTASLAKTSGLSCEVHLQDAPTPKAEDRSKYIYAVYASAWSYALIGIDLPLRWSILDRLLGGPGKGDGQPRDPSKIEEGILSDVVFKPLGDAYAKQWSSVKSLELPFRGIQLGLHHIPGAHSIDETENFEYTLRHNGTDGRVHILLPHAFLKPLSSLLDFRKLLGIPTGQNATAKESMAQLMADVPLALSVVMGRIHIPLRELTELNIGDVLRLDCRAEDEMIVEVAGRPRFKATPGKIKQSIGAQITRAI